MLGPGDERYFIYSPHDLPQESDGVIVTADVTVGDVDMYLSSSNKYPNATSNLKYVKIDND